MGVKKFVFVRVAVIKLKQDTQDKVQNSSLLKAYILKHML